jgi:hypothetical protein
MYSTADAKESEDAFMAAQIGALHERIRAVNAPLAAEHGVHYTSTTSSPYVYPVWYSAHSTDLVFAELFDDRFTPHSGGAQQLRIAQSEVGEESGQHTQVSSTLAAMEEAAIGELLREFGSGEHVPASRRRGPWVHLLLYGGRSGTQAGEGGVTCPHAGLVSCCAVPPAPADCQMGRASQSELPPALVWELRFGLLLGSTTTAEAAAQMARGGIEPIRVGVHDAAAAGEREQNVGLWTTNIAVLLQNAYVAKRGLASAFCR